jgi:two-component system response regulator QseB
MRLLRVEDDWMIGESLVRGLRDDGDAVDWIHNGIAAQVALAGRQAELSVVVLDWNLPREDGLSVLTALRATGSTVPILMSTTRDGVEDRVRGLDSDADDYLVQPFELVKLKARLLSFLQRVALRARSQIVNAKLTLDPVSHTIHRGEAVVSSAPREFALPRSLPEGPEAVLLRSQLKERLYGWDESVQSNAIAFLIHGQRGKLGSTVLENVRAVRWRMRHAS